MVLTDMRWLKITIECSLKMLHFNRMPVFYMRGYGIINKQTNLQKQQQPNMDVT